MGTLPKPTIDNAAWVKVISNATAGRVRNLSTNRCAVVRQDAGTAAPALSTDSIGEPLVGGTEYADYSYGPLAIGQDVYARSMDAATCILHVEV